MDSAQQFLSSSLSDGQLRLPSSQLLEFASKIQEFNKKPAAQYIIETQKIIGFARKDHVDLEFQLQVRVFQKGWTSVPLLAEGVTITKVDLVNGHFGLTGGMHSVLFEKEGTYNVSLSVVSVYSSDKKCGLSLSIPSASRTSLTFSIPQPSVSLNVTPCVNTVSTSTDTDTVTECNLPPSSSLNIQWTAKQIVQTVEDLVLAPQKKEPIVVNATQHTLFSIGEGICASNVTWEYRIVHDTKSEFQMNIDPRVRVTAVTGVNVKRWDVQRPASSLTTAPSTADAPATVATAPVVGSPVPGTELAQILRVSLDRAVEGTLTLNMTAEMDMEGTSCQIYLPTFSCDDTNKEIGFVGVEARTNVEINEFTALGVAKIDIGELGETVTGKASCPLLYAYKFLVPRYQIGLDVKKHADVDVLIAVADEGWVELIVSEDRVLTRSRLKIRNTQRQYMRTKLPSSEADVWSLLVNGVAAKPSQDQDHYYLVPLEKSGSGEQQSFWVEFVYLLPASKMERKGKFNFQLPLFDIPVNHLFVSLFAPKLFDYNKFETELQRVHHFTSMAPTDATMSETASVSVSLSSNVAPPPQAMMLSQKMDMQYDMMNAVTERKAKKSMSPFGGVSSTRGVKPVIVDVPRLGTEFKFERLLVINEGFHLAVEYKRRTRCGCFDVEE